MSYNIGVNVIETEGKTSPAIAGAPTSVAGLVVRSQRGPTDKAIRVSSFQQFVERFGGHSNDYVGAYCVEGFFLNGGQEAYIARATNANYTDESAKPTAATASLPSRYPGSNNALSVTAGYRGSEDVGAWANGLKLEISDNPKTSTKLAQSLDGNTPARLQGTPLNAPVDLSPVFVMQLKIDKDPPYEIKFSDLPNPHKSSPYDIVDLINNTVGQRVAKVQGNGILLSSRTKGKDSSLEISDISVPVVPGKNVCEMVGFTAENRTENGQDGSVAYPRIQVSSLAGFSLGEWVYLDDGITQDFFKIAQIITEDNHGRPQYFMEGQFPEGSSYNQYRLEDDARLSSCEFSLTVKRQQAGGKEVVLETWGQLCMDSAKSNYALSVINNPNTGSAYICVKEANTGAYTGRHMPAVGNVALGNGRDGFEPTVKDYSNVFNLFHTEDIQLLAVPEKLPAGVLKAVTTAGIDFCAGKGECMFVGHTIDGLGQEAAKNAGKEFQNAKVYGALYWPWIKVNDPLETGAFALKTIPPTGHVLGMYARIDQTRGIWKAPAGNEAVLKGALGVEQDITDRDHTDLVKNGSVNGIRKIRGAGIVVDSSRTLSTDTRWLYVNVRLLFNYVKASLREGLRWAKQEPNRETLWNTIKYNTVTPFLLRLYQAGAFGPGTPEEVFTVICGAENNPADEIMLGNLKVEVYFYPGRPAETIVIMVGQQDSGAQVNER